MDKFSRFPSLAIHTHARASRDTKENNVICKKIFHPKYSYATTSSSCLIHVFSLSLFCSSTLADISLIFKRFKRQFMTIIIHYFAYCSATSRTQRVCALALFCLMHPLLAWRPVTNRAILSSLLLFPFILARH
jgi:hypothetical protein